MKLPDIQRNLCLYGGSSFPRVVAIGTNLRKAKIIPGGRDNYSAPCNEVQAAIYALVVAGADTIAGAVDAAVAVQRMRNRGGETLIAALARQFAGQCSRKIRAVRVMIEAGGAEILLQTADDEELVERFAREDLWQQQGFNPCGIGAGYAGRIGHIGAGVIEQFKIDFSGITAGGWVDDEGELISE